MSKHKHTTIFCVAIVVATLAITVTFMASPNFGVAIAHMQPAYTEKLFSTDRVHTIDIVVKDSDWDNMITNALEEEYIQCSVVIDNESVKNVGIRPKGNSSLSMIASSDSDRYSFKIEFDHYEKGKNYFGLDKLALNNIAQDNTYMKDYITYQMMNGMGGATSLVYSDDDPDSYSAIFDNAVFDTSSADKARLIASLKQLNAGENIKQVVDVEEVIRYFVVHNFVLNSDSYTGSIVHNYYLAENNGKLSMIAWDYNLAFGGMGGFGGGMGGRPGNTNSEETETTTDSATSLVNYPIDSPMLSGSTDDKPMIGWIFDNEEYLAKYHEVFAEYMEYFDSGKFAEMYDSATALISPYVKKDPSAFCTYEEFQKGSTALREFCLGRAKSINGQLDGTIAATSQEQTATSNAGFVDASDIDIESMGSNSMGFGRAKGEQFPGRNRNGGENSNSSVNEGKETKTMPEDESNFTPPDMPVQGGFPAAAGNTGEDTSEAAMQNGINNNGRMSPNMGTRTAAETSEFPISANEVILLLVCAVFLIGGILFAKRWRRDW